MKKCAYCGHENADEATQCQQCGTGEFVVPAPPSPAPRQKLDRVPEVPGPELHMHMLPEEESVLCTSCLLPNRPETTWCTRCGAPIASTTAIVPTDAIASLGRVFRGALRPHPTVPILLGVWLLFFPGFIMNISVLLGMPLAFMRRTVGLLAFCIACWLALAGIVICSIMLYRVTRNACLRGSG